MPQNIDSKSFFVEEFVRDGRERNQECRKDGTIRCLQITFRSYAAFEQPVKQCMDQLALQRVDCDIALPSPSLINLRFGAMEAPGNRRRIDLTHRFQNDKGLLAHIEYTIAGRHEVIRRDRRVNPEMRDQKT